MATKYLDNIGLTHLWAKIKSYVTSILPTKTSELTNDSGYVTTATNQLTHYYLKSETYTQAEIDDLVSAASNFEYEVVQSLPTASSSTTGKFYIYNGHRYITTENNGSYSWVDLGSYDIDLTDYVTETELEIALENRPIHQEVTEIQLENMLDNETWEEGIIYYTVEED